jgi:AcrR family transcriptional regulator
MDRSEAVELLIRAEEARSAALRRRSQTYAAMVDLIIEVLEQTDMTVPEIAEATGLHVPAVYRMIRPKPNGGK